MKIVTGYTGTPHISSNDDQGRNQGLFGTGNYVLDVGEKFDATLTNATTVTVEDGEGVMQGVHFRIEPGTTEDVTISPGTTGYNRIDLICARYTKDAGTGVEAVALVVIEGTPSTSTPSAPSYTAGDILAGDTLAEFPIWKVTITGLAPALTKLANTVNGTYTTQGNLSTLNNTVSQHIAKAVAFYSGSNGTDTVTMSGSGSSYSGSTTVSIGALPAGNYFVFVSFLVGGNTTGIVSGINVNQGEVVVSSEHTILSATAYTNCLAFISQPSANPPTITARLGIEADSSGNRAISWLYQILKIG